MSITLPGKRRPEKVTKIDAARRQLATAITLWFTGGDTVSIYTLSHAAYEIIHALSRDKRNRDLLFDSIIIKDEYRSEFAAHLVKPANFFKHARRDRFDNPTIEFYPVVSEMFFMYSVIGIELSNLQLNDEEAAFVNWFCFNNPEMLTEKGRKVFADAPPVEALSEIRSLAKKEFFQIYLRMRRDSRA